MKYKYTFLCLVIILSIPIISAHISKTYSPSYSNNPNIIITEINLSDDNADGIINITVVLNVTNGNGSDGLGSWDINVTLWNTTAKNVNLSDFPNNTYEIKPSETNILAIETCDLDSDGDMDIIAGGDIWTLTLYLQVWNNTGNPDINTWEKTNVTWNVTPEGGFGAGVYDVSCGDIDGDGDNDLVTSGYFQNVTIWENPGHIDIGKWNATNFTGSGVAWSLDLADFDNDGDLDITFVTPGSTIPGGDHRVWLANNTGYEIDITKWTLKNYTFPDTHSPYEVEAADLNNDGYMDVVIGTSNATLHTLENDGSVDVSGWIIDNKTFTNHPGSFKELKFLDFDNDGDLDFTTIQSCHGDSDHYKLHLCENALGIINISLWTCSNLTYSGIGETEFMDVGDMDNDGDIDIVIISQNTSSNAFSYIYNYENPYNDILDDHIIEDWNVSNTTVNYYPESVRVSDWDTDGDLDILTFVYGEYDFIIFNNTRTTPSQIDSLVVSFTNVSGSTSIYNFTWTPDSYSGSFDLFGVADIIRQNPDNFEVDDRMSLIEVSLASDVTVDTIPASFPQSVKPGTIHDLNFTVIHTSNITNKFNYTCQSGQFCNTSLFNWTLVNASVTILADSNATNQSNMTVGNGTPDGSYAGEIWITRLSDNNITKINVSYTVAADSADVYIYPYPYTGVDSFTPSAMYSNQEQSRNLEVNNTGNYNATSCSLSSNFLEAYTSFNDTNFNITENTTKVVKWTISSPAAGTYSGSIELECVATSSSFNDTDTVTVNEFTVTQYSAPVSGNGGGGIGEKEELITIRASKPAIKLTIKFAPTETFQQFFIINEGKDDLDSATIYVSDVLDPYVTRIEVCESDGTGCVDDKVTIAAGDQKLVNIFVRVQEPFQFTKSGEIKIEKTGTIYMRMPMEISRMFVIGRLQYWLVMKAGFSDEWAFYILFALVFLSFMVFFKLATGLP